MPRLVCLIYNSYQKYIWKVEVQNNFSLSRFTQKISSWFVLPKPAFPSQTFEYCTVGKYTFLGWKILLEHKTFDMQLAQIGSEIIFEKVFLQF